ncbi:helix-turn-helix domain-containing protein [Leptospira mayottensis]|uniref:DNA-binding helix-turn-helix protein n=2 Tax=Leptospira mayottensis TaxID=1137606 RepID=A0AA87SVL8_9LEPT|nr:helix-turn-helix domain-containing protein [Leptospira mayottensis]AXR62771.1 helix-turn-helix domain-containing protein [Leptospira mayottensis]AXR66334.1 helix-turn-helix domain-containing protein [Leptospira mayottensis]AZQ04157.1 helix-turn-helix domain-containing protein [Leptospira mayottensis 200901116]EKR99222.1 DNA-binding helix-turn-helix protein [Leptospira mayottensis 200901122]TGN06744.1 helix-turn-helix domain-containing protein [Leptospira mayottensis]
MGEHYPYIKFFADIIESGVWANLSSAAKTLYLVLLKFSDQHFKPVWPSTEILLKLTGFKTKKSIIQGKRDLIQAGLLQVTPGTGHTSSRYYFCFNYPGSKIPPQGYIFGYPGDGSLETPEVSERHSRGSGEGTPNHINITITNNQNQEPTKKTYLSLNDLEEKYGSSILSEALSIAKTRGMETNLKYVQGICKNLMKTSNNSTMPEFNQNTKNPHEKDATWRGFLLWSRDRLTRSSIEVLEKIRVEPDGRTLCVLDLVPESLQMIIAKYFTEEISPPILVIFSAKSEENRTTSVKN